MQIINGDCLEVMRGMEPNSVDTIITDPPYGLSFMGKEWDHGIPGEPFWREALRVAKPGAILMACGGTRTHHRLMVAIEDAGWEIRDCMMYLYGSGFPKSYNIFNGLKLSRCGCTMKGRALPYTHKEATHEAQSTEPQTEHDLRPVRQTDIPQSVNNGDERGEILFAGLSQQSTPENGRARPESEPSGAEQSRVEGRRDDLQEEGQLQGHSLSESATVGATNGAAGWLHNGASARYGDDSGATVATNGSGTPHRPQPFEQRSEQSGTMALEQHSQEGRVGERCNKCGEFVDTTDIEQWRGYGSALKPAFEPIVVAQKPVDKGYAANAEKWGVAGLWIDGGRIDTNGETPKGSGKLDSWRVLEGRSDRQPHNGGNVTPTGGRWPSNIILDEPAAAALDAMSGERKGSGERKHLSRKRKGFKISGSVDNVQAANAPDTYGDTGGASRYFKTIPSEPSRFLYAAKASRAERNRGLEGMEARPAGVSGFRATDRGEYLDFVHPAPIGIGQWLREQRENAGLSVKALSVHFPSKTGGLTGCVSNWELEYNRPTPEQWWTLKSALGFDDRYDAAMTETRTIDKIVFDDRDRAKAQNHHPTVKPLALMRYLCRLTMTPTGGVVFDPFAGSGTTLMAALYEGREAIGIELDAEYCEIARRRVAAVMDELEAQREQPVQLALAGD